MEETLVNKTNAGEGGGSPGGYPGQGTVYRQGGSVNGEISYIRKRAQDMGLSMREPAERPGVSYNDMLQESRSRRNMGVKMQAREESALRAPARVAPERYPSIDRQGVCERMEVPGISRNEAARQAQVGSGDLYQIMNSSGRPSPGVLRRMHGVLYQRTGTDERVMPAEVKVLGWRNGERRRMVVRGAGGLGNGEGGGTIRTGGTLPWGVKVEYAFRTGYDGHERVSVTRIVERECSALLTRQEPAAA